MATLYNTIEKVASEGQNGVVYIDLLWDSNDQAAPLNASEQRSINGPIKISTSYEGYWEVTDIDLNSDITPVDNVYLVREYTDDEYIDYYVQITTPGSHWLGDVIVSKPAWVE